MSIRGAVGYRRCGRTRCLGCRRALCLLNDWSSFEGPPLWQLDALFGGWRGGSLGLREGHTEERKSESKNRAKGTQPACMNACHVLTPASAGRGSWSPWPLDVSTAWSQQSPTVASVCSHEECRRDLSRSLSLASLQVTPNNISSAQCNTEQYITDPKRLKLTWCDNTEQYINDRH